MKSPSQQAELLIKNKFSLIDEVYRESIPKEIIGNQAKTICLITEWLNELLIMQMPPLRDGQLALRCSFFIEKH